MTAGVADSGERFARTAVRYGSWKRTRSASVCGHRASASARSVSAPVSDRLSSAAMTSTTRDNIHIDGTLFNMQSRWLVLAGLVVLLAAGASAQTPANDAAPTRPSF